MALLRLHFQTLSTALTLLMFLFLKTFHAHFGIVVDADEMHTKAEWNDM